MKKPDATYSGLKNNAIRDIAGQSLTLRKSFRRNAPADMNSKYDANANHLKSKAASP
jgi:hypothetical protein